MTGTQAAKCAAGEHDETVAEDGRVTRLAFGRSVEPGTRYCRYCSQVLPRWDGSTGDPIAFLNARLDEDEAAAPSQRDPAGVLREVAAKRVLIGTIDHYKEDLGGYADLMLREMVAVYYGDQSDYRQEWAPEQLRLSVLIRAGRLGHKPGVLTEVPHHRAGVQFRHAGVPGGTGTATVRGRSRV
jgi:hypothetical protein